MAVRVLSIDGGGIRGVIPAFVLSKIERMYGELDKKFDLIAGTSTGGIIALAVAHGVKASDILNLYTNDGFKIFSDPRRIACIFSGAKYSCCGLRGALTNVLGEKLFAEANPKVMLTAYDIKHRSPDIYKSWDMPQHMLGVKSVDVALATSAAPTYFQPHSLPGGKIAIDGGVYCNNPSLVAYVEALRLWPNEKIDFISIGTGAEIESVTRANVVKWGKFHWTSNLLEYVFDGLSKNVDNIMTVYSKSTRRLDYERLNCELPEGCHGLDDVRRESIENLLLRAERMWESKKVVLDNYLAHEGLVDADPGANDIALDADSFYLRWSIFDIVKKELGKSVNLDHLNYVPGYTVTDLVYECTKMQGEVNKSYTAKIEKEITKARAKAFATKYAQIPRDEKCIPVCEIKIDGLQPWDVYLSEILKKEKISIEGMSVIDVGSGTARANEVLYSAVKKLLLVDISQDFLTHARNIFPSASSIVASAEDLSKVKNSSYDAYFSFRTYQSSLFDVHRSLREARRVLNARGIFVISVPIMFVNDDGTVAKGLLRHGDRVPSIGYAIDVASEIAISATRLQFSNVKCFLEESPYELYVMGCR